MHCVSIRSIAFKSFKTWFWNLSLSIESVDYGVWSVVPLCRSSSKRDCSNLYEIGTWCFDNINEGSDYTPLQSCLSVERSTGSLGVIGNAELFWLRVLWGGGEGSGGGGKGKRGRLNPRKLKKKEETFRAVEKMDSILLCICSTRRYRCCKNKREAQEAQQFQTLSLGEP